MQGPGKRGSGGLSSVFGLYGVLLLGLLIPVLGGGFPQQRATAMTGLLLSGLAWARLVWMGLARPELFAGRWGRAGIFLGALFLRAVVGAGDPGLSDDVHRYVWEGGLVAEGVSPYAWSPDAPELSEYRARWSGVYGRMNNRDVSAAYPPVVQAVFAGVVSLAGGPDARDGRAGVLGMRLAFTGFDLALLIALLVHFKRQPARALVWAWSPLVALEFAGSGHFDSLGIFLFMAGILALAGQGGQRVRGYGLLGMGILVKFMPLAALPYAIRDRRAFGRACLGVGAVLAAGLLPLFTLRGGFGGLGNGLSQYALRWESFSLFFRPLEWTLARYLQGGVWGLELGQLARLSVLLLLALVALWLWFKRVGVLRASACLVAVFLMLSPTLHPWYLTWLIPFLAFRPSLAWTGLMVLAPLLYWPLTEWQARAEWIEPAWLWPLVALSFGALVLFGGWGRWNVEHVSTTN